MNSQIKFTTKMKTKILLILMLISGSVCFGDDAKSMAKFLSFLNADLHAQGYKADKYFLNYVSYSFKPLVPNKYEKKIYDDLVVKDYPENIDKEQASNSYLVVNLVEIKNPRRTVFLFYNPKNYKLEKSAEKLFEEAQLDFSEIVTDGKSIVGPFAAAIQKLSAYLKTSNVPFRTVDGLTSIFFIEKGKQMSFTFSFGNRWDDPDRLALGAVFTFVYDLAADKFEVTYPPLKKK